MDMREVYLPGRNKAIEFRIGNLMVTAARHTLPYPNIQVTRNAVLQIAVAWFIIEWLR